MPAPKKNVKKSLKDPFEALPTAVSPTKQNKTTKDSYPLENLKHSNDDLLFKVTYPQGGRPKADMDEEEVGTAKPASSNGVSTPSEPDENINQQENTAPATKPQEKKSIDEDTTVE